MGMEMEVILKRSLLSFYNFLHCGGKKLDCLVCDLFIGPSFT